MPSVLAILATATVAYFLTFIYALIRNLLNARKTGLPYIIIPWDQNHLLWMVTCVPLRPWFERNLPTIIWERLNMCIYGWEFHAKMRPFEKFFNGGKSYIHVGCGRFEFWTRDPEFASQILGRPGDFVQFELTTLFVRRKTMAGNRLRLLTSPRWESSGTTS